MTRRKYSAEEKIGLVLDDQASDLSIIAERPTLTSGLGGNGIEIIAG